MDRYSMLMDRKLDIVTMWEFPIFICKFNAISSRSQCIHLCKLSHWFKSLEREVKMPEQSKQH